MLDQTLRGAHEDFNICHHFSNTLLADEAPASTCIDELAAQLCPIFKGTSSDVLERAENNTYVYNYYSMGSKDPLFERLEDSTETDPTVQKDPLSLARAERILGTTKEMLTELILNGQDRGNRPVVSWQDVSARVVDGFFLKSQLCSSGCAMHV